MSVEPIDWTRVKAIFDAAVVLDVRARSAYVEDACGTDGQLRQQVAALLVSHDRAESFLETPAAALIAHAAELSGRTVGSYRIVSRLGAGGMGDVYRARDTKLGRDVAIKVLPEAFAGDSDRVARFEREAQLLAALNHPHIAAIYGLEQSGSTKFLVLELVEGESLADRLQAGALPVEEAVAVALQTADALQAAHDKGIIHRDLKPGNIMLTAEGQVKVLDFGLAKLESGWSEPPGRGGELTNSPTLAATRAGMILGTAAYMAPEQAKGRAADKRSDIWAFGCVLYELLTGRRAFEGEGVGDTLAAILRGEPDWKALPHGVPANIRTILTGCLEKDRQKRLADMSVVQFLLTDGARIGAPIDGRPGGLERRPSGLRVAGIAAVSALVAGIAAAAITWTLIRSEPTVTRLDVVTPPTDDPMSFALSPDGRQLVFVASVENVSRLWVRPLDDVTAQPLPGTDGASYPFWSPDGRALGFFADGKLKRLDVGGGAPQVLADAPSGRGGSWSRDGFIVFAPTASGPLLRVSASGGPVAVLYAPDQVALEVTDGRRCSPTAAGCCSWLLEAEPSPACISHSSTDPESGASCRRIVPRRTRLERPCWSWIKARWWPAPSTSSVLSSATRRRWLHPWRKNKVRYQGRVFRVRDRCAGASCNGGGPASARLGRSPGRARGHHRPAGRERSHQSRARA